MFSLPVEIVQDVAGRLSQSELKALSSTSSGFRSALLPLIVKDMSIASADKLMAVAQSDPSLLHLIRTLTVTLNIDFFDSWGPESSSALASIVHQTPHIQSLTFQASNTPYDTPWNRVNITDPASRGLSLGLGSCDDDLPTFERLTHLDLQSISADNLDVLLARAPHLRSLAVTLPDGLSDPEATRLLDALRHVPHLKELSMSLADWVPCHQVDYARDVLRQVSALLPKLEKLDLRTRSYDLIDGVLNWKCVDVESVESDDLVSVVPSFPHLRVLRLPLRSPKGDATESSAAIAKLCPSLHTVSWMQTVHFEGRLDEYAVSRDASDSLTLTVTRLTPPLEREPSPADGQPANGGSRRAMSLFDTLFDSFISPSKPSVFSDIAVTVSVLMVIGSTLLSPFFVLFG